MITTWCKVYGS